MPVPSRNCCSITGFGEDYHKIRSFLIKTRNFNYSFGRWDWMVTHLWLDRSGLPKIGVWEKADEIVAVATYDCELGRGYFCVSDEYRELKAEMLEYAMAHLSKGGEFRALIPDTDTQFQEIAARRGFRPTQEKEADAYLPIHDPAQLEYRLPDGFSLVSLQDRFDLYRYGEVLWKGFNHELDGEGAYDPGREKLEALERELLRPNVNLSLKIAVCAPDGAFASYCGMWQDKDSDICIVEPVATVPEYRKLGLGKAVVLEGIRRCAELGARTAFVGSSQQFYYNIGFRPYGNSTWWEQTVSR